MESDLIMGSYISDDGKIYNLPSVLLYKLGEINICKPFCYKKRKTCIYF